MSSDFDHLVEARTRIASKIGPLEALMNKAAASHSTSEYSRLSGKVEGVKLALSFVDDEIRFASESAT